MKPEISLIIPCYNVQNYIDGCLGSIERQTIGMGRFEIILIDDASTDDTLTRLLEWKIRYPENIKVISHDRNRRQGTCRNDGLKIATGEYVAFLDADDWVESDMYEQLLEVACFGECDVVCCRNAIDYEYTPEKELPNRMTAEKDRLILIDSTQDRCRMIASNLLGTYVVTKLYRRSFIDENEIFFPEDVLFEDIFWMGLLNCYATKIGIVEQKLYHYYMNMTSVSRIRNNSQNRDIIKVNHMLWDEYDRRHLLEFSMYGELCDALRYEMLCTYYLTAVKMMFLRYDEIPYDMFYEVQQDMLDMIPDYAYNKYINDYTTQFNIMLLAVLDKELTTENIDDMASSMRLLLNVDTDRINNNGKSIIS